jgi:glycosyltransferase involved in cell wall biosynthesis
LGHEVTVFATDQSLSGDPVVPLNQPVDVGGVTVYYFKTDIPWSYAYSRTMRQACRRSMNDFDIVHLTSHWSYAAIPAASECQRQGVPFLISPLGSLTKAALRAKFWKKWPYFWAVEKKIAEKARAIRFETERERGLMPSGFNIPSFVIPTGYELEEFKQKIDAREARKTWGVSFEQKVVTYLGRLHPVKSLDFLIRAVALPSCREPDILLLLAGPDNGEEKKLRRLAKRLGLEDRVRFLGKINPRDRNSLFDCSDLVAMVSRNENFGNATVEAMLAGLPVLLSEHVGICREVAADAAGVVVPLEVKAIAEALVKMLSAPERLKVMGEVAAASARRRYDINVVAQQMLLAYEDILTGRRSPELSWADG